MKFVVCVPTLNAKDEWHEFSAALQEQTARPEEVLVIDSASEDGTPEIVRRNGFRLIGIARRDFRHGGTRQLAAEAAADCDVLVYLTQDAILANPNAISTLLRAFEDPSVAAAYGRQLPRTKAGPIEAHARLFNYPPVSEIHSKESIPSLGFKSIFFSNSFGAYRRSALQGVGGFPPDLNFGEDTVVAAKLIMAGWNIAYVAEATVRHSHGHTWKQEFKRYQHIGELHSQQGWLLHRFGGTSGEGLRFLLSETRYLLRTAPRLIPSAFVRTVCKYLGYRSGRRSRRTQGRDSRAELNADQIHTSLDNTDGPPRRQSR